MSDRIFALCLAVMTIVSLLWPLEALASTDSQRTASGLKVLAVETFLADIAQNVAGSRVKIDALLPVGADPHGFDPTPADVMKVTECNVLIVNGAGLEEFLDRLLKNAGGAHKVIDASAGLKSREPREGEEAEADGDQAQHETEEHHHEADPHFWLSPVNVIKYVENIRDGLSQADPRGRSIYTINTASYIAKLKELDHWIQKQVMQIPEGRRLLVTNHESLGYFADRYGFKVVGTIVPSVSTEASPSAKQLARLVEKIKETGVHAIFLETGTNKQVPRQVAEETGIKVEELYDHSVSEPGGPAPDYIAMMNYDTLTIVNALK
jgi:ABC-type Zn uptake system ZnuABC Zn-binding protein ZnuA